MFYIILTILLIFIYLIIQHFVIKKWEKQMIENINKAFVSLKVFFLITLVDKLSTKNKENIDDDLIL